MTASGVVRLLKGQTADMHWGLAANKFNTQLRTFNKGWSSNLWVGRGANYSSPIT
jgi:hypothetical protein